MPLNDKIQDHLARAGALWARVWPFADGGADEGDKVALRHIKERTSREVRPEPHRPARRGAGSPFVGRGYGRVGRKGR